LARKENRIYSRYTAVALNLLAGRIKASRLERGITAQDLAGRADISRDLLYRIERGDRACGIGVVFEVATLLGLTLFQPDHGDLAVHNKMIEDKLALLPRRARPAKAVVDDDF
jgi:transcriptional regulator with XRE-family HTH domain